MPNIIDATVVNEAYDTSGNGGRKLVRLSNGWLVNSLWNNAGTELRFYKSTDNGSTWSQICFLGVGSVVDHAIVSKDTTVYIIFSYSGNNRVTFAKFEAETQVNVNINNTIKDVDLSQSAIGNVSLAINPQGTELHACWSSKNTQYPNSFNIRYAKGTINADGSVMWGVVEQVTNVNTSGLYFTNPSCIVDSNSKPHIISDYSGGSNRFDIRLLNKNASGVNLGTGWYLVEIVMSTYTQSSPSAIFVPSEVNGLPNGRIWVAWHGLDNVDATKYNIRVSYSDDGGATWSAMQKLTSGNIYNQEFPSITVNSINEIFIVFRGITATSNNQRIIRKIKYDTTWSSIFDVTVADVSNGQLNPSTLYDVNLAFSEPLFIYQDVKNNKVGFYGKWTTVEISLVNKVFPNISWNTIAGDDSQVINTKLLINNVEVYSVDSPEGDVSYTINPDILLDTNSMKIVSTDSSGSEETKEFTINKSVGDIPLNKGVIRFDLPATDEIVVWYKQGAGLNIESKIAFGDETKQKTMVKDVLDGDYLINIEEA